MKKIILDTNFLMIPLQFRVDIFSEFQRICNFNYELYVFDETVNELKNIMQKQPSKHKKAAQFGLKLINLKNIGILKAKGSDTDRVIIDNSDKETIVATQDRLLRKKLLDKGISVVLLRQKKYLVLIERKAL